METGKRVTIPKQWQSENWQASWVPGVVVGNVAYVSGITASDETGTPVAIDDFKGQAERCLLKLSAVLARAGGSLGDVVKLTTYIVDTVDRSKIPEYFESRKAHFGSTAFASTGIFVSALARREYLLEIDAVAVIGSSRSDAEGTP